jgi:N-acetylglutamate synthase-like GNAT family acetyltransferase
MSGDEIERWTVAARAASARGTFIGSLNMVTVICSTPIRIPPSLSVRRATTHDAETIAEIVNRAYAEKEAFFVTGNRTSAENIRSLMASAAAGNVVDHCEFFVMEETEQCAHISGKCGEQRRRLVGSVQLRWNEQTKMASFGMLAVLPKYQKRNLSRALIQYIEDVAVEQHQCTKMRIDVVSVRPELLAFYEQLAFRRVNLMPWTTVGTYGPLLRPTHLIVMDKELTTRKRK